MVNRLATTTGRRRMAGLVLIAATATAVIGTMAQSRAEASAAAPTVQVIHEMQQAVETGGIDGFLTAARATGWKAPVMPSKWHLENVASPGQRPQGQAARDLGLALLVAIDDWAPKTLVEKRDALFAKAQGLLDLAYWAGSTEGYGNLIIGWRARDVAVVALGRLVADLEYPLSETSELVHRCRTPFDALDLHARVLNAEAGAEVLPSDTRVIEDRHLLTELFMLREAKNRWARSAERGGAPGDREGVRGLENRLQMRLERESLKARVVAKLGIDPDKPDPHDPFFDDDECPPPRTTQRCWSVKRHRRLTGPMVPAQLSRLETLLMFREKVGHFPLTVEKRTDRTPRPGVVSILDFWPEGRWAFSRAWEPYRTPGSANIGAVAWNVYDDIQKHSFLDDDTRAVQEFERQQFQRTPGAAETANPKPRVTP